MKGNVKRRKLSLVCGVLHKTVELSLIYMRYLHYKYSTALAYESYCLTPSPES